MTQFEDYWARLARKNPGLADETLVMRITVASLRRQVAKAHHAGFKSGMVTAGQLQNLGGSGEIEPFEQMMAALRKKRT